MVLSVPPPPRSAHVNPHRQHWQRSEKGSSLTYCVEGRLGGAQHHLLLIRVRGRGGNKRLWKGGRGTAGHLLLLQIPSDAKSPRPIHGKAVLTIKARTMAMRCILNGACVAKALSS